MAKKVKDSPIQREVGGVFIPVKNVEKAKTWYCKMLGIPESGKVEFGHLYVLPMEGVDVILDEMPRWSGNNEGGTASYQAPAFMFRTEDIYASYEYMKMMGADLVTEVENNQWFVFKDPDGNHIMVCR
ncbi:VOC family protein [Virgibacillus oceani]